MYGRLSALRALSVVSEHVRTPHLHRYTNQIVSLYNWYPRALSQPQKVLRKHIHMPRYLGFVWAKTGGRDGCEYFWYVILRNV